MQISMKPSFSAELKADEEKKNFRREVRDAFYSYVEPRKPSNPSWVSYSPELVNSLGIKGIKEEGNGWLDFLSGKETLPNFNPYSMVYGGHQFGHWAGQLGDGRAINIAEMSTPDDQSWVLQLKGAGETPFSRSADGLAVLRSSIREFLASEAMFHLGVPTTRALSLVKTGDQVLRDIMYDGNPEYETGAIVCRAAPSFVRFGNFEILAARKEKENIKQLLAHCIQNYYPQLGSPSKKTYIQFFREVATRTRDMIIHWQRVGFVHGVMNTDNMSILGLTIDYGPFGWLDNYDQNWTPNTTDSQHRRYKYMNQPSIGLWNLLRLANAIYPVIEDTEPLEAILKEYQEEIKVKYLQMMGEKIGFQSLSESDYLLIQKLEQLLELEETDMTIFFRLLCDFDEDQDLASMSSKEVVQYFKNAFYDWEEVRATSLQAWKIWFLEYQKRLNELGEHPILRAKRMKLINPKYILRNYMAQEVIDAAEKGEYELLEEVFDLLKRPYDEQPNREKWFARRPDWAKNKVGCSMLSCSS